MIDSRVRISREASTEELQQIRECARLGGMVMRPERLELAIEPDAVEVFEAALEMWITFDVVEQVARLRLG